MKNLYYLLLLVVSEVYGQTPGHTWETYFNTSVRALAPLPNGRWLVGGAIGSDDGLLTNAYLAETTAEGALLQFKKHDLKERSVATLIHVLPDGRRIVAGIAADCDVLGTGYLQLQDTEGAPLWTIVDKLDTPINDFIPEILALVVSDKQEIIIAGRFLIRSYDLETGNPLQQFNTQDEEFSGIVPAHGGKGYVVAGLKDIYLLDSDFKINKITGLVQPSDRYTKLIAGSGGKYFILQNDNKINLLQWAGTVPVIQAADPGFVVNDMVRTPTGLALCGLDGGLSRVAFLDSNLVEQHGFTLTTPELIATKIQLNADGPPIILAGVELHGPSPRNWNKTWPYLSGSQHFWMQSFLLDGSAVLSTADAALTEVIVHKEPKAVPAYLSNQYWNIINGTFSVRLKNNGLETLNSVDIVAGHYGYKYTNYLCRTQDFTIKSFSNLQLPPGAETDLYIGAVEVNYTTHASPWQLCFWATVPNGTTDIDHENDFFCRDFQLTTASHEPGMAEITLYPNPAQETVYLGTPAGQPGLCHIFNAAGQLVSEQLPIGNQDIYTLDVRHLYPGFYIVQTALGAGRFVKM